MTTREPGRAYALDTPERREWIGLTGDDRCADGAVWLPNEGALVFVELKSGSFHEAEEQLRSTVIASLRRVRALRCDTEVRAAVVMRGSAPPDLARVIARFRRATGVRLIVRSGVRQLEAASLIRS